MKQHTTPEQTAKLIELGFKPPMWRVARKFDDQPPRKIITSFGVLRTASYEDVYAYSIGELIEMLPTIVDDFTLWIGRDERSNQWFVKYHPRTLVVDEELIDALYNMLVQLKVEGYEKM